MATTDQPLNILLADDSASIRTVLVAMLVDLGHDVVAEVDGVEAVKRFEQRRFDLVLLDVVMPNMDGYEATQQIKALAVQQQRWVPIIIISAAEDKEAVIRGLDCGAEDFLTKPVHPKLLSAKIESYARSIEHYHRLLLNEQRAIAISEGVVDAIVTIDVQGIVLSCNQATQRIFGYNREEIVGQNVSMLMPEPYRSQHDGYLANYLQSGEPRIIGHCGRELQGIRKDGVTIDLRLGVSEIHLPNGEHVFIGVLGDITLQKAQEASIRQNAEKLTRFNDEITSDMEIATGVMDRLIFKEALQDSQLRHHLLPASQLSGDLIAAVRSFGGILYVMIADATGHGLAAAINLLPALWVFYGMARKDCTVPEIAAAINTRLKETMPVGRFVAAHIASVNNPARTIRLWSGGMPPAYFVENHSSEIRTLRAPHLALGILSSEQFDPQTEIIEWAMPSQLFFCSDGLTEAQNETGEMFGDERLQQLLLAEDKNTVFTGIVAAIETHLNSQAALDDISMLSVLLP